MGGPWTPLCRCTQRARRPAGPPAARRLCHDAHMTETMRAARFLGPGQPLRIEEMPVPEPGPHEVVVRVEACGICLSDVHLLEGTLPGTVLPVTPGHEAAGTVARVGDLVRGWSEGERAVMAGGRPCLSCARCRTGRLEECLALEVMGFAYDGAWATHVVVPFFALSPLPDGVPVEQAAILADAVSTPYAALAETGGLRPGESVGLWGIGGLGTHAVQLARLLGAGLVVAVDPLESARERATSLGADLALDPSGELSGPIREATDGLGLDLALDLVGSNAILTQAVSELGRGGRLVSVGMTLEPIALGPGAIFNFRQTSLLGHLGYGKRHLDELVRMLATGRLDLSGSISGEVPLDRVEEGVVQLRDKVGDPVRVLVRP